MLLLTSMDIFHVKKAGYPKTLLCFRAFLLLDASFKPQQTRYIFPEILIIKDYKNVVYLKEKGLMRLEYSESVSKSTLFTKLISAPAGNDLKQDMNFVPSI